MSRCGNCGAENHNGNDICSACELEYYEAQERVREREQYEADENEARARDEQEQHDRAMYEQQQADDYAGPFSEPEGP